MIRTLKQQKLAIALLKRALMLKDNFDTALDDKHTKEIRKFLINLGAIPDRRKGIK